MVLRMKKTESDRDQEMMMMMMMMREIDQDQETTMITMTMTARKMRMRSKPPSEELQGQEITHLNLKEETDRDREMMTVQEGLQDQMLQGQEIAHLLLQGVRPLVQETILKNQMRGKDLKDITYLRVTQVHLLFQVPPWRMLKKSL